MRANRLVLTMVAAFLVIGATAVSLDGFRMPGLSLVLAEDKAKTPKKEGAAEKGDQPPPKAGEPKPCPECPECPDVAKVVLKGLEEKKQAVAAAMESLAQQKKELETYEAQVDEKLVQLSEVKEQIKADMARLEEKKTQQEQEKEAAFEAKMVRLVKMYAGMKPKNAAQIVDKMELEVAQEIFLRMREAPASEILAFVDSEKAAKISERLAFKKK